MVINVETLPNGYRPVVKFEDVLGNRTVYCFRTAKYRIEATYKASNFYSPDFFNVTAKTAEGEVIWSGGDTLFLDNIFSAEFISNRFNKMVLIKVNDTRSPQYNQVVLVDLATGSETIIGNEGNYGACGHFQSFDAVYSVNNNGVQCTLFNSNTTVQLSSLLTKHFGQIAAWWVCPVENCILVVTKAEENNLHLFDITQQQVKTQATIPQQKADNLTFTLALSKEGDAVMAALAYAKRNEAGILTPAQTLNYRISFSVLG